MGGEVVVGELGDDGWSFGVGDAGGAVDWGLGIGNGVGKEL